MKKEEFLLLPITEQVQSINRRIDELKKENKTTKQFKNEEFEFSYSTAVRILDEYGYARDGEKFIKELRLTSDDVVKLKNLTYLYNSLILPEKKPDIKRRPDDELTVTSMRMYSNVLLRWQCFCEDWNIFNSPDLIATALEKYMDDLGYDDFEILEKEGKVSKLIEKKEKKNRSKK